MIFEIIYCVRISIVKNKGSNLNTIERRLLGVRPAGMEIADPDGFKQMRWVQEMKKEVKSIRSENKHKTEKEE